MIMKKQLIGAAAAILMLVGCSSGAKTETKTCTAESNGQAFDVVLKAEDSIVKEIAIQMDIDMGMDFSDDDLDLMKSVILSGLGFEEGEDVKVDLSSKDGIIHVEIIFDASSESQFMQSLGIDSSGELPLDEMVAELEKAGATCK